MIPRYNYKAGSRNLSVDFFDISVYDKIVYFSILQLAKWIADGRPDMVDMYGYDIRRYRKYQIHAT